MDEEVIEIKSPLSDVAANQQTENSLAEILGVSDYLLDPSFSKFNCVKNLSQTRSAARLDNPEMIMHEEGKDWKLVEREAKIDVGADSREALQNMVFDDHTKIQAGPAKEGRAPQQFIVCGPSGICIMGREGVTDKMAIKFKHHISQKGATLVRTETVWPFSETALEEAIQRVGGKPEIEYPRTPYFTRQRVQRPILCTDTGSIFVVTADHCVAEDERPPLEQLELEYRGQLSTEDQPAATAPDHDKIDADFDRIRAVLMSKLRRAGLRPRPSTTTKYDWIRKPYAPSPESAFLPHRQSFQNAHHAEISVISHDGSLWLRKDFDVDGLGFDIEQLRPLYLTYRDQASQVYGVPSIKRCEVATDHSFYSQEQYIEGKGGEDVIRDGNLLQIAQVAARIFLPLKDQVMPGFKISDDYHSHFPTRIFVDVKPANWVLGTDGRLYYVDFSPPRLRDSQNMLFPHSDVLDAGKHDKLTYIYGDLVPVMTRFVLKCIQINPDIACGLTNYCIGLAREIDPSGRLLAEIKQNAHRSKVVADFSATASSKSALKLLQSSIGSQASYKS